LKKNTKTLTALALGAGSLLLACGSHYENSFETVTITRGADNLVTVNATVGCHTVGVANCLGPDGICVEAQFGTIDLDAGANDAGAADAGAGDAGFTDAGSSDAGATDGGVDYLVDVVVTAQETVRVCHPDDTGGAFVLRSTLPVPTAVGAVQLSVNSEGGRPGDWRRTYLIP
jgi:hypothetical protein